ncbi:MULTISPECIES: phage tail protein [Citrobacter freundii complex]|uniref:phage tail fiber protein n=1 Tax=Citrobacter freundii complex TaxID=1344959 RepID=UPI0024DEA40F|nr:MULTISPECIES: phage tail protein [Citrobacter freundii complex]MDK2581740.1 phage tail protein [Citrobacter portucalensis]MDT7333437.1 phage tail protein [Citrobacter freundii]
MSAGTLTLTNNSAAVAGNGTAFATEVAAGDFIVVTVGGVPYTLPVKSVESGTALTLVSNYTGPTQSGAAWSAVPRVALNMVTAALVAQSAEALRGLNYDKQNWQSIFSGTGTATVRLPDGSSFTGPAWGGITDTLNNINTALNGKLEQQQNLKDLEDKAASRLNLGLGSAAVLNSGSALNQVLTVTNSGEKTFGLGALYPDNLTNTSLGSNALGFFRQSGASGYDWYGDWGGGITFAYSLPSKFTMFVSQAGIVSFSMISAGGVETWRAKVLTNRNTTVDSGGFIKTASPIVKVFHNGQSEVNDESEGCVVERLSVGQYLITGCIGLNSDAAWGGMDGGFEIPVDRNKQPRIWLDYKVNADGSVLIRTYHRVYPSAPSFAQNRIGNTDINGVFTETVADGELVDIPADSFVSVRVEMPQNSIWNQKQKDMLEAMEKAEYERQQNQQDAQV